jgi:putative protease
VTADERYQLEMTFSRGLFSGWMHGVDHQHLVPARSGKKRGPFVGRIESVGGDYVEIRAKVPLKAGDGVVFDTGGDTNAEQGGRLWQVKGDRLYFERGRIDFRRLQRGHRVWKTDDPDLDKRLRQSFTGRIEPRHREKIDLTVRGQAGEPLIIEARRANGASTSIRSKVPLQAARTAPLGIEKLREHLGRFGEHPYELDELSNELSGDVIVPISELNRLRRELTYALDAANQRRRAESPKRWREVFQNRPYQDSSSGELELAVLCRSEESLAAALIEGVRTIYVDFEDIRRYVSAVTHVREVKSDSQIILATPRIQKAGEHGFFRLIENAKPDGVLIRNLGAIDYFAAHTNLRRIGDFSLNVANPLSAQYFIAKGLEKVTISYDLTAEQVVDLVQASAPDWFELTIHQHMPMFHMEHCVFAAFMSKGSSFLDCGRPCESHRVHLRDRVGMEHPLRADVGCRNTLFNAVPQTGAGYFSQFASAGLRHFRVELLEENEAESRKILRAYQALLKGDQAGADLWRSLKAQSQLGVTRGTLSE